MPFRSETEAIREQVRRLEEEASELDLERAALTCALELKSPRVDGVVYLLVTAVVATVLGWGAGARRSSQAREEEMAGVERFEKQERDQYASAQRACESNDGATRAELSSCLAQLDSSRRLVPETAPCHCIASDAQCDCPFDRGAAASALRSVDLHRCFVPPRPATFHARLTFEGRSGGVQTAAVDTGDLTEPEKRCVVATLQRVKVPAFGGGAVNVGKSFAVGGLR